MEPRGAGAGGDDPLGVAHLVVDPTQHRSLLIGDGAGDDDQVGLARAEAHQFSAKARDVVHRRDHAHELDPAAGGAEGERPQAVATAPVDHCLGPGGDELA